MKNWFSRIAAASTGRPWLVLAIIGLITLAAAIGMLRIRMEFSQRALLPEGYESIDTIGEVEEEFGGIEYEKVLLTGTDFTSSDAALAMYEYGLELEAGADHGLWGDFVLGVDGYLSRLARNPLAAPIFELLSSFRGSPSPRELQSMVEEYISSPEADYLRSDPQAAFLVDALEDFAASDTPGYRMAAVETALGYAVEGAISEYLADERARDFLVGRTITGDHREALINVQVVPDLPQSVMMDRAEELRAFTEDFFSRYDIVAEVSGQTYLMMDIQSMSIRDGMILGLAALAFIILVLFLTFRKLLDIFLTLGVVIISMVWVFGLMGYAGIPYTIMSIAIVPLLLGIDIAYAIHVLTRYYEEMSGGADSVTSVRGSVSTVGVAVFLAAATTMFGFLSFFISDMPPMRDFGVLCLAGVFFSFALCITLLPAALVIRDRRRDGKASSKGRRNRILEWVDRGLVRLSLLAEGHRRSVWTAILLLVAVCIVLATGLSTSADFRTFVPEDLPSYRIFTRIEDSFGGQDTTVALVEGDDALSPESLRSMDLFIREVLNDPRNITPEEEERYFEPNRVSGLPTVLLALQGELPASTSEAEVLLERAADEFGFDTGLLLSRDREKALIVFDVFFVDEEGEKEMAAILSDSAAELNSTSDSLEYRVTGMPLIISDTLDKLFSTQVNTAGLALLLCALLVILVFRSLQYGLAATSVVFLAIVLELGILRLIGWPLDIMTVMIASLVIGAGIDFGIHIAHRFREEVYDRGMAPEEAINTTVRSVGTALIPAAVTTAGAFLILAISELAPLRRFGVITAVALLSALFAALVIEPTFLASIALRKAGKREGGADEPGGN